MFGKKKSKRFSDDAEKLLNDIEENQEDTDGVSEGEDSSAKKEYRVESVQSVVPVKNIYRGMIITSDDRYVKILEILPINFSLKSIEEQDNIIHLFASWLRIAPSNLQFKIITRRADTTQIIRNVLLAAEEETHPACRELTENHIQFIRDLSGQEALSRKFFLVFEYEPAASRTKTLDDIADDVAEAARKIRAGLAQCGNEVIFPQNDDYFQAEILYTYFNRKSCGTELLSDRVIRVTTDRMETLGLKEGIDPYPDIPIVDYISPRGISFLHDDYFICDGQYISVLFVKRDGYPSAVVGGWMSSIIESGDGVDVDIIFRKENRAQVRDKVALKLKLNRIKASSRSDVDTDYEEIEGAIDSARFIKASISNGEDFYHMYTFITIAADTHEELLRRKENIAEYLYSRDIESKEVRLRLEDAFQVTAPLLTFRQELMNFASRNVMTFGAASTFPFASCEICDENGIVLGVNRRYQSVVNIDIFNTKKYKNANIAILGTTGAGKTFCELLMAMRMRYQGIQTFIIAPDKAHEMMRACNHIGGSYIRISPGAKSCINIMEIRPVVNPIAEFLDETDMAEGDSWLSQKTSQLLTFFHILIPDLTNEEEQLADEAIIKTYNRFNITHDNDSIYQPGTKTIRKMPIIGDLFEELKANPETRRVGNILGRFVTGSAASFNRQTNVDLTNKFIVFDLQDLQGTMKAVGMFIVMDFLWARIKANRTERKAIFIDEGWQLIGASSDSRAADFVYRIFKIIRGYGGSAVFATQDISDLFAFQEGKYGKAIISNSKIKIVLGLEQQEAKCVQDVLQLTKSEVRSITNFNRGEGLICANNNKVPVFIRASKEEKELITTDPNQLREIIQQRQQEMEREKEALRRMQPPALTTPPLEQEGVVAAEDGHLLKKPPEGLTEDAWLTLQAMEQLSATEVARNQDGSLDSYRDGPELVRVESEDDDVFAEEILAAPEKKRTEEGAQSQQPDLSVIAEEDEDLAVASEFPTQKNMDGVAKSSPKIGGVYFGSHPPAEF